MNPMRKTITLLLFFATFFSAHAQFTVNGEFRSRGTVDHGYFTPALSNTKAEFWIDQRTRLNFGYTTDKFSSYVSLQDARIWGSDDLITKAGTWGNSGSLGLHEAWVDLNLGAAGNLKIGRQEWNYDNMRLLSYRNWLTSALSYDGLLYQTRLAGLDLDLGLSYNNNTSAHRIADNTGWQPDKLKSLNFLHVQKSFSKSTHISFVSVLSAKTDTAGNSLVGTGTHGLVFNYNKGKAGVDGLFGTLEGYYQHGNDLKRGSDGEYRNISAYMLVAELGLRTMDKKLELTAGAELLSGHDYSNTDAGYANTRQSFDLLYGGRFPYYGGNLNHFIIQDSYLVGTKSGGYFDPYFKAKYVIDNKNSFEAGIWAPVLSTKVRAHTGINKTTKKPTGAEVDGNGNAVYWQGSLGQYFDLTYTHKFSKEIILKTGASYGLLSDIKKQMAFGYADTAGKELHKTGHNYFGWMMLIVKPNFYNGK